MIVSCTVPPWMTLEVYWPRIYQALMSEPLMGESEALGMRLQHNILKLARQEGTTRAACVFCSTLVLTCWKWPQSSGSRFLQG